MKFQKLSASLEKKLNFGEKKYQFFKKYHYSEKQKSLLYLNMGLACQQTKVYQLGYRDYKIWRYKYSVVVS